MNPSLVRVALDVPVPTGFDYRAEQVGPEDIGRRVLVPFGRGEKVGLILELPQASALPVDKLKPVRHIFRELPPLPTDWLELVRFCARYYQHPLGEVIALALPPRLRQRAQPVKRPARVPPLTGGTLTDAGRAALAQASLNPRSLAQRLLRAAEAAGGLDAAAIRALSRQAPQHWRQLLEKGWVAAAPAAPPPAGPPAPLLHAAQRAALETIAAALGRFQPFLLHGITGSGKTEVYLQLIERVLARGQQALLLVPEIALTPQLEARVSGRFPNARRIRLHSALPAGERAAGFVAALEDQVDIVLGTRLSVFTPLPRLGLILVDEEHDPSFKQQEGLRYSARDLAIWRAKQRGVPIVLGSATPSLESWAAAQSGRYHLLELKARAVASSLPQVRCLDTRREKLPDGVSEHLHEALRKRLERGEQSLLFLNRRGYAPVLACAACGWVSRCSACAANRVLHLADRRLRCHHCGRESAIPQACPVCGNQDLHPFGRGTQRLEETLAERHPGARILRVDRDNTKSQSRWHAVLETIQRGEVDILVGTQMLAKGHDFPRLTLVGVLNADAALFAADFRAPERLFSQLMQVGGRSGRADLPGEVLIQTQYPEHPLYRALVANDFPGYADAQLAEREQAGFPPFTHQALLRAEARELEQALTFLKTAIQAGVSLDHEAIELYDAVPMRLQRRAHLERAQLLVESRSRARLQAFLPLWLSAVREIRMPTGLRWHLDVDPQEF